MFKRYIEYIKDNPGGYWFKRKLFGWGWTPAKWQGWAVLFGFIALITLNAFRLDLHSQPPEDAPKKFVLETFTLVSIMIWICFKKGEKPRWQWGIPEKKDSR